MPAQFVSSQENPPKTNRTFQMSGCLAQVFCRSIPDRTVVSFSNGSCPKVDTRPKGRTCLRYANERFVFTASNIVEMAVKRDENPNNHASGWKSLFISGGAGFIGSYLVRLSLKDPRFERVVIFDNFSSGQVSHTEESRNEPRVEVVNADFKDLGAVAVVGCDTVRSR